MIIIEATVPNLGRFFVEDDFSVEEVLFLPSVQDAEVHLLEKRMQDRNSFFRYRKEIFLSALASIYGVGEDFVTFHQLIERELRGEGVLL